MGSVLRRSRSKSTQRASAHHQFLDAYWPSGQRAPHGTQPSSGTTVNQAITDTRNYPSEYLSIQSLRELDALQTGQVPQISLQPGALCTAQWNRSDDLGPTDSQMLVRQPLERLSNRAG